MPGVSATSREDFAEANRASALALQRLCEGDLRGMFDGPTSAGSTSTRRWSSSTSAPCSDSAALGILMTCAAAWLQAIVERKRAAEQEGRESPKLISVVDEGWRVASHIGVAEWLQAELQALPRPRRAEHHRPAPPLRPRRRRRGGSREARLAEGLIADADTKVIYRQPPDQLELLRARLGLTRTEAELCRRCAAARRSGWSGGAPSSSSTALAVERELVDTDARMVERREAA